MIAIRRLVSSLFKVVLAAAIIATLAGVVVATGAVSGQDGLIRACVKKKGGTLRISDGKCRKRERSLQFNQRGPKGDAGPPGATGVAGRSALEPLHSGETIHGVWAIRGDPAVASHQHTGVTFPIPAPGPVDSLHVVFDANDEVTGDGCTGSAAAPVAGPGFVCIYAANSSSTTAAFGVGALGVSTDALVTGDGSPYGFIAFATGTANWYASGTWAYTAP